MSPHLKVCVFIFFSLFSPETKFPLSFRTPSLCDFHFHSSTSAPLPSPPHSTPLWLLIGHSGTSFSWPLMLQPEFWIKIIVPQEKNKHNTPTNILAGMLRIHPSTFVCLSTRFLFVKPRSTCINQSEVLPFMVRPKTGPVLDEPCLM